MTTTMPSLLGITTEGILDRFEFFIQLGYTKEEFIKMSASLPALYNYSTDKITSRVRELLEFGYTKEEVIIISKVFPAIFSFSSESLSLKLDYYKFLNIERSFIKAPKNLIQSIELSYARYEFFKQNNMFMGSEQFKQLYGITNEEIIRMYDYNKTIVGNNNERTI